MESWVGEREKWHEIGQRENVNGLQVARCEILVCMVNDQILMKNLGD
jgi:hypothetical protein